jgi:hypothetical protein
MKSPPPYGQPRSFCPLPDQLKLAVAIWDSLHDSIVARTFAKAVNRMGTARNCKLAILFLTMKALCDQW